MKDQARLNRLQKEAEECAELRRTVADQLGKELIKIAEIMSGVIGSGGKIMLAGNGGSAAEASHFAAEMVVRLTAARERQALPAIALCVDTSVMTAAGNDYGFDRIFSRQVEAMGNKGDMLVVMSTSGNSSNLVNAVKTARDKGILTIGMLGGSGGQLIRLVDRALVVPHSSTQRIQEEHLFMVHTLVELIESDLFA